MELPALEEAAAPVEAPATPGMTPVTLVIPDGTFPGMEMSVEWGGVSYSIAVPEGSGPGQEITVLPPSCEAGPPPAGRPLATNEYEMVGRRAELVGLVAQTVLNGRQGLVTEYPEDRGRLLVRLDGTQEYVMVKMCSLKELGEGVPLLAPFDPNLVHILVRVRFHDELLFSAHRTWAPRAPRPWTEAEEVGGPLQERSHAVIDLAMTPPAPTLTTPATLFGHQEGMADEHTGAYGAYEAANDDAWLRRTDVARNEQLGTFFSEATWGETQRQTCPAKDAFQVDIRLVHVHPTCEKMQPACKKGECEPRDMRWANLCTSAARFRTEAGEMFMRPDEMCGDDRLCGISRANNKAYWRLSAALPFGNDYGPLPVSGESVDGIFYHEPGEDCEQWLEVNFDLESTLQPWSSSSQVHAVRSASLGIVWRVPGSFGKCQVGVMEKVPSRIEFERDTHGWQA